MLSVSSISTIQRALNDAGLDGWLLYDFRGTNTIASTLIGLEGMVTRRYFVFVPTDGAPTAITHAIEQQSWLRWPVAWNKVVYSSWRALESEIRQLVAGKRIAMEYSPGDAVPYLDRVPAGMIELVRESGAEVVSSGELVSRFYATWSPEGIASHKRSAEVIADLAREAFSYTASAVRAAQPITEWDVVARLLEGFKRHGLETDHGPHVAINANAADPHYEPTSAVSAAIHDNCVLLIDLWAKEPNGIYADQTWMATLGSPSPRVVEVWNAVRDARDAAIDVVRTRIAAGDIPRGADIDDASRAVIDQRGFARYFTHRTGHSIDARELHGSGPNLDNLESRDERRLVPGVGFSIEPGIYLTGEFGVRSEVNAFVGEREVTITPKVYQHELIVA
jgi:Xaa-Pro dipeptidase